MAEMKGSVGKFELTWKSVPRGRNGEAHVELNDGRRIKVRWQVDSAGVWVELPDGVHGFDIQAVPDDEGSRVYDVQERVADREWTGLCFQREGEKYLAAAAEGRKKAVKVKSQMPGKIVKIMVEPGQEVERGEPVLVMEAMKMENEITAPHPGRIKEVKVEAGQAVESGAVLVAIE